MTAGPAVLDFHFLCHLYLTVIQRGEYHIANSDGSNLLIAKFYAFFGPVALCQQKLTIFKDIPKDQNDPKNKDDLKMGTPQKL